MAMNYTTLVADKSTDGSIKNWVNYANLPSTTILEEAQTLIYSLLRTREMMTQLAFNLNVGFAHIALPSRFLDPIGRLTLTSYNVPVLHKDSNFVQQARTYTESSGTLGTNPFTTVSNSNNVSVALADHGFMQDSVFNTSGATAFNGVTIEGTFPITDLADDGNSFTIDISSLGTTPSGSGAGGGSAVDYLCDNLTQGLPKWWGIWDETIYFDVAFAQQSIGRMQYYQSLPLLSSTVPTNFLTTRYPQLVRVATQCAAADFMKDTEEYNKSFQRLQAIVQRINVENDGQLRGMELDPMIP